MDQITIGSMASVAEIDLTTFPDACDVLGQDHGKQNVRYLRFSFQSSSGPYTAGQTFHVSSGQAGQPVYAYWELTGSDCSLLSPNQGGGGEADGTLTFTDVSANGIKGTFDLTFTAGHVTGSFDAPFCASCGATGSVCTPSCTP